MKEIENGTEIIPGWEAVRYIGGGSFGKVYEAKKTGCEDGEEFHSAIKVISIPQSPEEYDAYRDDGFDEESITTIFKSRVDDITSEFKMMSQLKGNTNIVSYEDHDIVQHDDKRGWDVIIRMEMLTPLPKMLEDKEVRDEEVIKLGIGICSALELCKKKNIIHRDIKPQNIFINEFGEYKLGDFGIAKTMDHVTKGSRIGTMPYIAPEVYLGKPYDAKIDQYSLGLVLYWLLNERRLPFLPLPPENLTMDQQEEAMGRRLSGEALPRPKHGSDELARIVLRACAYDPNRRFASPSEMKSALKSLEDQTTPIVNRLEIKTLPTKLFYHVGDTLNTEGLSLTLINGSGKSETVIDRFTCSPTLLSSAGTITVMVSYKGSAVPFQVTVIEDAVSMIAIKSLPTKTTYSVGDMLNTKGLTLTAIYKSGRTETVTDGFTCSPMQLNYPGNTQIIASYRGKAAAFSVIATKKKKWLPVVIVFGALMIFVLLFLLIRCGGSDDPDNSDYSEESSESDESQESIEESEVIWNVASLEVKEFPKKEYFIGDELDLSGVVLVAHGVGGESQEIKSGYEYEVEPFDEEKEYTVIFSYKQCQATAVVNVREPALVELTLKKAPEKNIYYVGEPIDLSGMLFTATFENGSSKDQTSISLDEFTCKDSISGDDVGKEKTITVSYKGKEISFKVSVIKTEIASVELTQAPTKKDYYVGDALDLSGIRLTIKHNDGALEEMNADYITYESEIMKSAGEKEIYISYQGIKADKSFHVTVHGITYTIQYDPNGGSGKTAESIHTVGSEKKLTANGFKKTGYTFTGWKDQSGKKYSDQQTVKDLSKTPGSVVILYAQWEANTYTVEYDKNGGDAGATVNSNHKYNQSESLSANGFTRIGHTFSGWNTKKDGSGTQYRDRDYVRNLTAEPNGRIILYAQWTANSYTVFYDKNGASGGETESSVHVFGVAKKLRKNGFERTGYSFAGWNTKANGSGEAYQNEEAVLNLTSSSSITLYAQWEIEYYTYQIVYRSVNGTDLGKSEISSFYGSTLSVEPQTIDGYVTPASQTVTWDQKDKQIVFKYVPKTVPASQKLASGTWNYYNGTSTVLYDFVVEYQNRTENSIQIRIKWTNTMKKGWYYGYSQYYNAKIGGNSSGDVLIASSSAWSSPDSAKDRSETGTSNWITIPVSATQTSLSIQVHYWGGTTNDNLSATAQIPTY